MTAAELQITRGRAVANWNSRGLAAAPAGASSGRGGPGDPAGDSAGLPRASLPLLSWVSTSLLAGLALLRPQQLPQGPDPAEEEAAGTPAWGERP